MGNEPVSQMLAGYSCSVCGTKSAPEQRELESESYALANNQNKHTSHSSSQQPKHRTSSSSSSVSTLSSTQQILAPSTHSQPSQQQQTSHQPQEHNLNRHSPANSSNLDIYHRDFDFDGWLAHHGLTDIKHIFYRHNMKSVGSLSMETNAYRNFCLDGELKTNHPHLLHVAVNAIEEFNKPKNKNIHIIEEEDDTDAKQSVYSTPSDEQQMHNAPDIVLHKETDASLIRKQSLELCTEQFSQFVKQKVSTKRGSHRIWQTLDVEHKGYIETVDELANVIGFIALLYRKQGADKQESAAVDEQQKQEERELVQKQADQIALWVAKSYGTISTTETKEIQYKYRVTKSEFFAQLPTWIEQYAASEGTL